MQKNNILHPISAKALFQRIRIDIVGLLMITWQENYYIVIVIDYFIKWPIAKLLKKAIAKAVSKFIYEKIICKHGCLKVLQSDRETHFVNKVIIDLIKKFRIKYHLSFLYHCQINGFIKRYNQILCKKQAKIANKID